MKWRCIRHLSWSLKKMIYLWIYVWESSLGTWRLESELRLSGNHPEEKKKVMRWNSREQ